jgi:hypothetical protein
MKTSYIVGLCAALVIATFHVMGNAPPTTPTFHDLRTIDPADYVGLIDPYSPEVAKYAARLGSLEEAYSFVAEKIKFVPHASPASPDQTIERGEGNCLGKAVLLTSLYRALGVPSEEVRIIRGVVMSAGGPAEHVWVDIEHKGNCLQQDPSGMLGDFGFDEYPGMSFSKRYVMIENYCFNDKGFALISQLNRMGR